MVSIIKKVARVDAQTKGDEELGKTDERTIGDRD